MLIYTSIKCIPTHKRTYKFNYEKGLFDNYWQ